MLESSNFTETQLQFVGALDIGCELDSLYVYPCIEKSTGKTVPVICLLIEEMDKMVPIGVLFSEEDYVENYEYPKPKKDVEDYKYKGIPLTTLI